MDLPRRGIKPICYHPLKAYHLGWHESGKPRYKIMPMTIKDTPTDKDIITIPCGKCIGCRLRYSLEWANRLMLEMQYHDSAYFVTLTYSNDFLPMHPMSDDNGVYLRDVPTLNKAHMSRFVKHVRKHFGQGIRYYGCGEYGPSTMRPHMHIILYGLRLDDLVLYKRPPTGGCLYTSRSLSDCWANYFGIDKDGKVCYDHIGHVVVAPVTWHTCAYVARYVNKKADASVDEYVAKTGVQAPFALMSRRPGIGRQWYDDHPDYVESDYIYLSTDRGARKARPPKYFERLLALDDPDLAAARSADRVERAKQSSSVLMESLDIPYLDYLRLVEEMAADKIKLLQRSDTDA